MDNNFTVIKGSADIENSNRIMRTIALHDCWKRQYHNACLLYTSNFGDKKFLCVLPTLKECERYRDSINAEISSPECWGTKQNHLQHLITSGRNIATTHALIANANETTLELLSLSLIHISMIGLYL